MFVGVGITVNQNGWDIMGKTIAIGLQDFEKVIANECFYIDKTHFIRDWWDKKDDVTLITRPRRFGKTLNMSMLEHFFSVDHAGRGDLFERLAIWEDKDYRKLQGTYPVISFSFANIKETFGQRLFNSIKLRTPRTVRI